MENMTIQDLKKELAKWRTVALCSLLVAAFLCGSMLQRKRDVTIKLELPRKVVDQQ